MRNLTRTPGLRLLMHLAVVIGFWFVMMYVNERVDPLMNYYIALAAMYATAMFGMVILVGLSGQVSLGNGALMAIGGYVFALTSMNWTTVPILGWEWNPIWAMVFAGLGGVVIGLIVGVIGARLRGPYLAGLTLGLAVGIPAIANKFPELLGGETGLIIDVPYPPEGLGLEFPLERWLAWIAVAAACIVGFIALNLVRGRQGRVWRAVRDDPVAAAISGISPSEAKLSAFVVSSLFAALAGAVLAQILSYVGPGAFGLALSLSLLVGVVLGGRASLGGALIGAVLLVALPEFVLNISSEREWSEEITNNAPNLIYGLLVVLVVLIAPGGLMGTLGSGTRWIGRRGRAINGSRRDPTNNRVPLA